MIRVRLAVFLLCAVPALAVAQRGGSGGGGGGSKGMSGTGKKENWDDVAEKRAPAGPTISAKDFDDVSIYKILVDKKKDLKLSDAQIASFKEADAKLKDANADRFKLLDSLKKDAKPRTSGTPSAEDEARMVIAREALQGVVRDIRGSFDGAAKEAVAKLDESQQKAGADVMDKYNEEMLDLMRSKMGGGGRGGPGGGRGGRPPG